MIPIIDLFAGPGGLSEGFSKVQLNGKPFFDVRLSIEKDPAAHKTLEFRSFYRQFIKKGKKVPKEYYEVLQETDPSERERKRKLLLAKYPEGAEASSEARCIELGVSTRKETDSLIVKALGNAHRKRWVLIGGPPCQAYSLAGRSRMGGINQNDHRVFLYKEYLRIIAVHQPAVFIMENVKGLLSANLDGESIFHKIINDLKFPNNIFKTDETAEYEIYSVVKSSVKTEKDFVVKSEQYGIPQKRHRIILVGVRKDIQKRPSLLKPSLKEITLESIIGGLPPIRSGISRSFKQSRLIEGKKKRTYQTVGDDDNTWSELLNSFKETVFSWSGFKETDFNGRMRTPKHGKGAEFIECSDTLSEEHPLYKWYIDPKLNGIANHESRSHLVEDLKRYFFSSLFTNKYKRFPRLSDYASHNKQLMPDHKNVKTGKFNDRFRVQLRDTPATTITSHISKDGHYFIHYDIKQCRSLTVREAARIQTFPDNYLFCGSRTQQFHQVGNAVPPYLAKQIGDLIKKLFI